MNKKILRYSNKIFIFILGIVSTGIGGCAMKYGAPTSEFHFFGRITDDKTEEAIENIAIVVKGNDYIQDSVLTNSDGVFLSTGWMENMRAVDWEICVKDIDDSLHGSYHPITTTFTTTYKDMSNTDPEDEWDEGILYRNINFALHSKE